MWREITMVLLIATCAILWLRQRNARTENSVLRAEVVKLRDRLRTRRP